jgi:teichuronic acid biosynthesis glycosyltransferase TuaG
MLTTVLIIDDGSTDSSKHIIQEYAAEDSRIRAILHQTNCRIAKTLNDAIAAAKGKFIANVDSDDVLAKDKPTKQLARRVQRKPDSLVRRRSN